jgi:manganese/zinc/iron transport system substrate-binding protein
MVADLVRQVGGDRVHVEAIMGEGVDPHTFKASPADVSQLHSADIAFYSGLHLEGKLGDVLAHLSRRKPVIAVAESIPRDRMLSDGPDAHDPHIWFDVSLWSMALDAVLTELERFDPASAGVYRDNAARYRSQLAQLHQECIDQIASIPKERRVLITAHDAFRYFGRAYAIEVKAIQGISTETEAGLKEVNDLVAFISDRKIRAVFVESSVNKRNVQSLVEGCQSRGHAVEIGGELFSDAMGPAGTPEGAYLGMVRHNVSTIVNALK